MKMLKVLLSVLAMSFVMVGCGGGGSSDSTTTESPTTEPPTTEPTYTTLADLEFSTLNFTEYWHVLDITLFSTMGFTNNYITTSEGTPVLVDELNSHSDAAGCQLLTIQGLDWTYMCVRAWVSGAGAGYVLNIDSTGSITGLFEYSDTGDTDEIVAGLMSSDLADAWVTGTITSNVATKQSKVVDTVIDNQSKLSEFDSIIPQPIKQQSTSDSVMTEKLDEMFNQLILKDEL